MDRQTVKVIVAHPNRQHSYQTATALKKRGMLLKYITTVYDRPGSLTARMKRLLGAGSRKKLEAYHCDGLENGDVIQFCERLSLLHMLVMRVEGKGWLSHRLYNRILKAFNRKVSQYAKESPAGAIILYDSLSGEAVAQLREETPRIKRVIDMSAPFYPYMTKLFTEELVRNDGASLNAELQTILHHKRLERSQQELGGGDAFLAASEFTRKSLLAYGAAAERIYLCRYGIRPPPVCDHSHEAGVLHCLYVGNINRKKGVHYLLEAAGRLDSPFRLVLAGSYTQSPDLYRQYHLQYRFLGYVSKEKLAECYRWTDVLVFPSLADGYGFSALEALSYGVPVICSENCGVRDYIQDGVNGFVVPAADAGAIARALRWFQENPQRLAEMRSQALHSVAGSRWPSYEESLVGAIERVIGMRCPLETGEGEGRA